MSIDHGLDLDVLAGCWSRVEAGEFKSVTSVVVVRGGRPAVRG